MKVQNMKFLHVNIAHFKLYHYLCQRCFIIKIDFYLSNIHNLI